MIVAAAVCPGPPFLVPGLAPRLAHAVPGLVAASTAAVASLAATERIVVVTTGFRDVGPVRRGPGWVITASSLARSDLPVVECVRLPADPGAGPSPVAGAGRSPIPGADASECLAASWGEADPGGAAAVGTIVAAHLLETAAVGVPTTAVEIDPDAPEPADQVRALVADLDDGVATGLLVIADGAAAHGGHAPAAEDPAAPEFDRALLSALAQADPDALASFCRDRAGEADALRCESLPAWAALAGLTIGSPPTSPSTTGSSSRPSTRIRPTTTTRPTTRRTGRPTAGLIDYYGAPFGVGYIVAEWQWQSTG